MESAQTLPTAELAAHTADQSVETETSEDNLDDTASVEGAVSAAETEPLDEKETELVEKKPKWPGWPGYSVFRIVVPVLKVGGIIGRKGDLVKKLVEETHAKIRVLDGPITSPDRIVLISGKEEPEAVLPPAVNAIIRIFKRVNGLPENDDGDKTHASAGTAFCSVRLLVPSTQAISLIGKRGSLIKSFQESAGASVRVLSNDEKPIYASSDERIVELQGEALKVLKALEAVVGHLRNFLVDHCVLPLFEKNYNTPATQERQADVWSDSSSWRATSQTSLGVDYPVSTKRDSLFLDRESHVDSHITPSRFSLYGAEHGLGSRTSVGRSGGLFVAQIVQTMQIPIAYAEDIIGIQGANIDYIRRSSGAILTVHERMGLPEEITVEIKGTSSQVQAAQQLIQEFMNGHREPLSGSYGTLESSLRSSYSHLGGSDSYSSSLFSGQTYGGRGSSGGGGGYGGYRLSFGRQ